MLHEEERNGKGLLSNEIGDFFSHNFGFYITGTGSGCVSGLNPTLGLDFWAKLFLDYALASKLCG